MSKLKGYILALSLLIILFALVSLTLHYFNVNLASDREEDFVSKFFHMRLIFYAVFLVVWRLFSKSYVHYVRDMHLMKTESDERFTSKMKLSYIESMEKTSNSTNKPVVFLKITAFMAFIEIVMIRQFTF